MIQSPLVQCVLLAFASSDLECMRAVYEESKTCVMKVLNAYHEHMLIAISYTFLVGNASRSGLLKFSSQVEPSSVTSPLERGCDKLCCFDKAVESALR